MPTSNLIALGHYSRTGKDLLASLLQDQLGGVETCRLFSFAGLLKRVCHDVCGWGGLREAAYYNTSEGEPLRNEVLPAFGLTPVELWIKIGTELFRNEIHPDVWVNALMGEVADWLAAGAHWAIITDMRFPNEWDAVIDAGGVVVKVERPGVLPRESVSDLALADYATWDFIVENNGSVADLAAAGRQLLARRRFAYGSAERISAIDSNVALLN